MNDVSHLISMLAVPTAADGYPSVTRVTESGVLKRIQIKEGPNRNAIVLQHPQATHWNGYVLVSKSLWFGQFESYVRKEANKICDGITYAGPSNRFICWYGPTLRGRISVPVNLQSDDIDFWVGFSNMYSGLDEDETMAQTYALGRIIWDMLL